MIIACDNTLDPIDKDTGIYAIYGALDLNKETNYIRVKGLKAPFTAEATRNIDAAVTLENLRLGTKQVLEESAVMEYEGIFLHNFEVTGKIIPDTRYRLTAKRSDGVTVSVITATPTRPPPSATPINQDCYTPITVEFEPVKGGTIVLRVGYPFTINGHWNPAQVLKADENASGGKITYTFIPNEQVRFVTGTGGKLRCHHLDGTNFYISYFHYGPGFHEKIINDPFNILASTDRFGAFYADTLVIPVDTSRVCPPDC